MTATIETTEASEAVRNGTAYLDEHEPGWRDRIDADRLDVGNPFCCVIGQLLGDFYKLPLLGLSFSNVDRMGFDVGSDHDKAELNAAWRQELA